MNTQEIMDLAVSMAGFDHVPADSAIYVPGSGIRKILFGVDIDSAELLLARELGCDAAISHHPHGAMINWYLPDAWRVYGDHVHHLMRHGIPEEEARAAVAPGLLLWRISCQGSNYDKNVSLARLLKLPFLNIHQPLDELGRQIMQTKVDEVLARRGPDTTVGDLVAGLATIPELARAKTEITVPVGDPSNRVKRAVVAHGALTNGGYEVAAAYFRHGVDTVIYIHIGAEAVTRLGREGQGNLIVTGHIPADAIGINPFVAALRERGVEVISVNGVI